MVKQCLRNTIFSLPAAPNDAIAVRQALGRVRLDEIAASRREQIR